MPHATINHPPAIQALQATKLNFLSLPPPPLPYKIRLSVSASPASLFFPSQWINIPLILQEPTDGTCTQHDPPRLHHRTNQYCIPILTVDFMLLLLSRTDPGHIPLAIPHSP